MDILEQVELLYIETEDFLLYMKGVPFDRKYTSLKQYKKQLLYENEKMDLKFDGEVERFEVFDVESNTLQPYQSNQFSPIFFENGIYTVVIEPKTNCSIEFYHEHPALRKAVSRVGKGKTSILMGQVDFRNEVGYSTFSILKNGIPILEVTLEIYPSKLSYKEDYYKLIQEVNDEIYNLAFYFIKKTYLTGSTISSNNPSPSEFFRLITHYFKSFVQAIKLIESQPHFQLQKEYELVRAERIIRNDIKTKRFLVKNKQFFTEGPNGIEVNGKQLVPKKGLNVKKIITTDTLENRFSKWMIMRIGNKIDDLIQRITRQNSFFKVEADEKIINQILSMKNHLQNFLKNPFWSQISLLDRTVINLVMQMKPGYRDAYKIYLILMKGITLQGELLKMSVKDVATLYEYWTYLKMSQILRKHLISEEQDVIKVKYGSLFVNLDDTSSAKQVFRHPLTNERIVLSYQRRANHLPTVRQMPDIMLEISKKDSEYSFIYIFDAKYRINFGNEYSNKISLPGPMEEDINTMHRYRDALVMKKDGPYERYAFGAYVLFPWDDEDNYETHPFYKSIDEVNIGGLPFLPNAVALVERLLERLINSNPEELQEEGILPRGTISHWQSKLEEKVLVLSINQPDLYKFIKQNRLVKWDYKTLKSGWEKCKYVALYVTQDVSRELNVENGIQFYAEVKNIEIINEADEVFVNFKVGAWKTLETTITPVGYGIQNNLITTINLLKHSKELPEIFMKFGEEKKLWRMLRRLTSNVHTKLDTRLLDKAKKIQTYQIGLFSVDLDIDKEEIVVSNFDQILKTIPLQKLRSEPTYVFKELRNTIFRD